MLQQTVSSKGASALFARLAVFGLTTLVALGATRALAQTPAPAAGTAATAGAPTAGSKPAWIVACEADTQKHCADDVKAKRDVRACLAKNEATLTQSCKDGFLAKYKVLQLCKGDFDKLCPGITDGKSLAKCLNEKQAQVSDPCRTAMTRGSKQFKKEGATADKAATKTATP